VPCDSGDVFHCNDDKGRCIPLSMKCDGSWADCPNGMLMKKAAVRTSIVIEY
jgi:hypothetical protein